MTEMFIKMWSQTVVSSFIADSDEDQDWSNAKRKKWKTQLLIAIKEGDVQEVQLLLDSAPGELCDVLNAPLTEKITKPTGRLHYSNPDSFGSNCFRFSLPIILAAVHGDLEILDLLCHNGASIYTKDVEGDNVIHALIWIAAFNPAKERGLSLIYQKLMKQARTDENKKMLLLVDDNDGLRPIELAAKLSTFVLLGCITDTMGVYKSVLAVSPIARKVRYDFSEYESRSGETKVRIVVSPLNFLRMIPDEEMEKAGAKEIFEGPVMTKWIQVKLRQSHRVMVLPLINLILCIIGITLADEYGHSNYTCPANSTVTAFNVHSQVKWAIFYTGVVMSIFNSCLYILFVLKGMCSVKRVHPSGTRRVMRPWALQKNKDVGMENGRVFHFLCLAKAVLLSIHAIVTLTVPNWFEGTSGEVMLMNRVVLQILLWMLALYYVQLLPWIGYTISGALKCFKISFSFLVVFIIFYVSASEGLRSIARYFCFPQMGYSEDSIYTTFLIMLNMFDMRELVTASAHHSLPIIFIHVFIVAVLGIMLLNYLIALFSEAVGNVERHRAIIKNITMLNVAMDSIFVQMECYELLPECLRAKPTPFYIDIEEYTV
ncbi:uncharacterized protein LOC135503352 [Lineus longissimus]|uniref:uncharacterized protein LOC135503352 n=1 Tax=Lineus longissimus TaxID=88925 RepID=UPI00315CC313